MSAQSNLDRIAAWEQAGLIDPTTAGRLRQAEEGEAGQPFAGADRPPSGNQPRGLVLSLPIGITELFAYLGSFFVLGAWETSVTTNIPDIDANRWTWGILALGVPAVALSAFGYWLTSRGDGRSRRAAGLAWLVAIWYVVGAVFLAEGELGLRDPLVMGLVAFGCGLLAAVAFCWRLPALTTLFGLVASGFLTALYGQVWVHVTILGSSWPVLAEGVSSAAALVWIGYTALWWWCVAGVIEIVAETCTGRTRPGVVGRMALTRFLGGLVAVFGTEMAVTVSQRDPARLYWSVRVLEPAAGDLILIGVCAVLLVLGARLRTGAYLWPAALGVLIALSEVNATYLASSDTASALFVEALILFGVAGAAHLFRRTLTGADPWPGT
jgi:hypothetical protein